MSASSWIKWFPSDFLHGVSGLSVEEIGVYAIVLNLIYDSSGPVPCDFARLARRCAMRPTTFKKVLDGLLEQGKLTLQEGMLSNPRAEKEIKSRSKVSQKSSENATQRWSKVDEKLNGFNGRPNADEMRNECGSDAIPDTRYQIPDSEYSSLRSEHSESLLPIDDLIAPIDIKPKRAAPNRFEEGWLAFPAKGRQRSSKSGSAKLWPSMARAAGGEDKLISAIQAYAQSADATREGGQFVPAMERWLKHTKFEPFLISTPPPDRFGPLGREDWQ